MSTSHPRLLSVRLYWEYNSTTLTSVFYGVYLEIKLQPLDYALSQNRTREAGKHVTKPAIIHRWIGGHFLGVNDDHRLSKYGSSIDSAPVS